MENDSWAKHPPGGVITEPTERTDVASNEVEGVRCEQCNAPKTGEYHDDEGACLFPSGHPEFPRGDESIPLPVVDGSDGTVRVIEVDGQPALVDARPQPAQPIAPGYTLESLVHELVAKDREIAGLEDDKKEITEALKDRNKEREEILSRMKHLDAVGSQLPLVAQTEEA